MEWSEAIRPESGPDPEVTLDEEDSASGTDDPADPSTLPNRATDRNGFDSKLRSDERRTGPHELAYELVAGETFGRYEVLHQLGAGGMGVVYAAYDPQLDRKVAVKLLHGWHWGPSRSRSAPERLLREARAMAKLSAPNVVTVHDIGTIDGSLYVAMEFIDGVPLSVWQRRHRGDWRRVVDVYLEAARGLEAAHAAGLIHRDFKPDNVMIGNDGRVIVMDFGLVRPIDADERTDDGDPTLDDDSKERSSTLTRTGAVVGTPAYMSPEQHSGLPVDARSDQFSFCASMYESLYGERPFGGDSAIEISFAIMEGRLRPVPSGSLVPAWVHRVVVRGLASDAHARFEDMAALRAALDADPSERRRRSIAAGVAGLVGLAVIGVLATRTPTPVGPPPCHGADALVAEVWNPGVAEQIGARFRATELAYADQSLAIVTTTLGDYATQWSRAHTAACMDANVYKTHSVELLDRRMGCLQRRRNELHAAAEVLRVADRSSVEAAGAVLRTLGPLDECANLDALAQTLPPPHGPGQRDRVETDRRLLAEATALQAAHQLGPARLRLDEVRADLSALDYGPLHAEFDLRDAALTAETGDHARAREGFERAVVEARMAGHDALATVAMTELVFLLAGPEDDLRGAQTWAGLARANLPSRPGRGQPGPGAAVRRRGHPRGRGGGPQRRARGLDRGHGHLCARPGRSRGQRRRHAQQPRGAPVRGG